MASGDDMLGSGGRWPDVTVANVRSYVEGVDRTVPLLDGRRAPYVNLDNAATTPPFRTVLDCVREFSGWYSSVHRGAGLKSRISTRLYERCRELVAGFVGADPECHAVVFVQNATHALNKLARRFCKAPHGGVIMATAMEHHSNLLPWRQCHCAVECADVQRADGSLDLSDLETRIRRNAGRLCLVAVTGASNVTGAISPLGRIARLAHEHGVPVAVDATQLVPHRAFRMGAPDDPERVDYCAFSAHKMYAPFGCGVLIGPRQTFEDGARDMVGGGMVQAVADDEAAWAAPPRGEEAGTPNVLGALALAAAVKTLQTIGMDEVAAHERELTRRALSALGAVGGLTIMGNGSWDPDADRLGVIAFDVNGLNHAKLAAVLGHEWGIGVRSGCFCAQPYVRRLLAIPDGEVPVMMQRLAAGGHATVPGLVRASMGVYNTAEEVDYLAEALRSVLAHGPKGRYVIDPECGDYVPEHAPLNLDALLPF